MRHLALIRRLRRPADAGRPRAAARAALLALAMALVAGAPPARAGAAGGEELSERVARALADAAASVEARVVAWRRDFHQHPELGNRETRTAGIVADHLEGLGMRVRRGVAHTGVVGVLEGGRPGRTVALRADMDALPVTEETGLPFASTVRTQYAGREVGVMHACGHDAHTAILMGVAQVLAAQRETLPGRVVFLFQPAEEGPPAGERGGARLMIEEGALADPRPDAVFGLHVVPQHAAGEIAVRAGGAMAGSNRLEIRVLGRQTHAAYPWLGVDPIAVASQIVLALQAIPGRRMDARLPSVVSFGAVHGGVRHNIIPDEVELLGTIRHLEPAMRDALFERVRSTAVKIAESQDAVAEVTIPEGYPVTYNDPALTAAMRPTLQRVAGKGLVEGLPRTGAEDFAFYAQEVPGLFIWLGIRPPDVAAADAVPNHSPRFVIDESALPLGVHALSALARDFLEAGAR